MNTISTRDSVSRCPRLKFLNHLAGAALSPAWCVGQRREDAEHEAASRGGGVDLRALTGEYPQAQEIRPLPPRPILRLQH